MRQLHTCNAVNESKSDQNGHKGSPISHLADCPIIIIIPEELITFYSNNIFLMLTKCGQTVNCIIYVHATNTRGHLLYTLLCHNKK